MESSKAETVVLAEECPVKQVQSVAPAGEIMHDVVNPDFEDATVFKELAQVYSNEVCMYVWKIICRSTGTIRGTKDSWLHVAVPWMP